MMKRQIAGGTTWTVLVLTLAAGLPAAVAADDADEQQATIVLDGRTILRVFSVDRTPVVLGEDGKFKPAFIPQGGRAAPLQIEDYQSPLPEPGWQSVEFGDSEWDRRRAPLEKDRGQREGRNPGALHDATSNAMICARAKFLVDDPAKVGDLTLSLRYVGGVAVFVNGKELTRQHLPAGELKPETLAEKYPDDLYVHSNGKWLLHIEKFMTDEEKALFQKRYRELTAVKIPGSMLRKGLNVLAVQLHRAPVNEAATKVERRIYSGLSRMPGLPAYVGLAELKLTARAGAAVVPNVARPQGVQVWNCSPFDTMSVNAYGDPGDMPGAVEIDAVRNGAFSGRFVISSDAAVEDLRITASSLRAAEGGGQLGADAMILRCGRRAVPSESSRAEYLFDGLDDVLPSQIPLVEERFGRGAVLPVWVTVRVPKDAAPGLYEGDVTVEAKGLAKTVLPVQCRVHGWTLPDPVDYRVKQLNVFSPYSLAEHYGVPLWSEQHFKLIEQSFRLMAQVNGRRVDIDMAPVIRAYWSPVEHCMFRLVPRKDGQGYDYDFSVIERIFDLVEKTMKKPLPLQVNCWGWAPNKAGIAEHHKALLVWDPQTGKHSTVVNPPPGSEQSYELWKPILDELRKRIEKRGWWGVTALGRQSYANPPSSQEIAVAKRIWPDAAWSYSSHEGRLGANWGGMPILYSECVWTAGRLEPRGYRRLLAPGRDKSIWDYSFRDGHRDSSPLSTLLNIPEDAIMRGHDGLGYLCVDFFPVPNPTRKKGNTRVLDSKCGNILGASTVALLAAGPKGPQASGRYEAFRYGVYCCEAIIYLQRALDAKQIDGELAKRVNEYLDARSTAFLRDWHVNRLAADRRLFALAAEVTGASR